LYNSKRLRREIHSRLIEKLLAKGEVQGLEGEVLKRTVEQNTVKQALLNLIIV
jgi:hypothetical protein